MLQKQKWIKPYHVSFAALNTSGYTGVYANGDGVKGVAECPFEFYNTWVKNPLEAQRMAERVTRSTIGVKCCPVVRGYKAWVDHIFRFRSWSHINTAIASSAPLTLR